jgi:hypothetical protein
VFRHDYQFAADYAGNIVFLACKQRIRQRVDDDFSVRAVIRAADGVI